MNGDNADKDADRVHAARIILVDDNPAIELPDKLVASLGIAEDDEVKLSVRDGTLLLEFVPRG
jgi:anaerobic selenocysteine-containing dehydrogenase